MKFAQTSSIAVVVFVLIAMLSGCTFKTDIDDAQSKRLTISDTTWRPQPVAARIYPSTRFLKKNNKPILEARIELLDEMGDSVKGGGWVSFELLEDIGPVGSGAGTQLYTWDVDLTTLHSQKQYYDPVSRGYLLQLLLDEYKIAQKGAVLKVVFTTAEGKRLRDQQSVR